MVVAVHRHKLTERLGEVIHRVLQAGIVEGRTEQLLELRAHVRGHGLPERTHRGHALRELAQKIVPILRASGELGVLPLERLEVRLSALHALLQRAIEVPDHLSRALELLGSKVLQRLAHVLEVRAEDLLLQLLQELLVFLRCLRLDELVVLERAHRATEILRQCVELRHSFRRELLHRRLQLLVRCFRVPPPIESIALELLHLLELLLELVEGLREIVPLCAALLRGAQPLEQVLQPLHAARYSPAGESRHRILEVAA